MSGLSLHTLSNKHGARRRAKRVGRGVGSGNGKTCGRGQKGQMSRSGRKRKRGFEGGQMRFIRRIPKRGFTSMELHAFVPVNAGALSVFDEGTVVDVAMMKSAGLARGAIRGVKILGGGELKKKLVVRASAFSAGARSKIEAAGGSCETV